MMTHGNGSQLRPELLLHPTIPAPLHCITPREILGKKWWDVTRKIAYEKTDDHCYACGIHKTKSPYRKYLEAHESYDIYYDTCTVQLKEVVALCHSCHSYIHVGRLLKQYHEGVISRNYLTNILNHGIMVLSRAELKPQATQAIHWLMLSKAYSKSDAIHYAIKQGLERDKFRLETWDNWKIIIDGKTYTGIPQTDWSVKYNGKQ